MTEEQLAFFEKATKGVLEGEAGKPVREVTKVTAENLPELDVMMMKNAIPQLEEYNKGDEPFFMSINFTKNHQPNIPTAGYEGKSPGKSKYADAVQELDHHIGNIMDKIKEVGFEGDQKWNIPLGIGIL